MRLRRTTARALRWPVTTLVTALGALVVAALLVVPTFASAQTGPQGQWQPGPVGPKPTVVLVHGAWADASSWDNVIPVLQHEGYTVDAPPNPLRGLTGDSAYLASYLSTISGPIVLVGHSYGGRSLPTWPMGTRTSRPSFSSMPLSRPRARPWSS